MESTHNYLFLSDLHISEGRDPETGLLQPNEDFFHDRSFAELIAYHVNLSRKPEAADYYQKPWKLFINGDIFDFLQVVSKPAEDGDGQVTLNVVDDEGNSVQVRKKLSANEKIYGLGTTSAEIVWKLNKIAAGHPLFFQALAWFAAHEGNELVLMKGNHDIEIYWPSVRKRMSQLFVEAYEDWQEAVKRGDGETPLPHHAGLPETLTADQIEKVIEFPATYYYEEGLFYVEHGCQYDPANAFTNFEDPRLPDAQDYIELPEGSLFVRYFFNKIELIHPFADNIKPISRYIFWLVRNAASSLFSILIVLLPGYLRAMRQVNQKTRTHRHRADTRQAETNFDKELHSIQDERLAAMKQASKKTSYRMLFSVLLVVVSILLFIWAIRLLAAGSFLWMGITLVVAIVFLFASSYLFQSLDALLANPFLYHSAVKVCQLLNNPQDGTYNSVHYHIFGHDHSADVRPIILADGNQPDFRQWYVNTGAWVPVFNEEERLLRDDEQLTFMRLVPNRVTQDRNTPELMQWSPDANAPREVRVVG